MGGDDVDFGDGVAWLRGPLIGKGTYGRVYHATLKPTSKHSCFPAAMAVKSAEVSASGSIQKEAEILNNLRGCPHIIGCYGEETTVGPTGVMAYNMLLEYASGGTLGGRIRELGGGGLPEVEAKGYARSILMGLVCAHNLGYVHCDLKPENVLLVERRGKFAAKIGDFGLAKRGGRLGPPLEWRGTRAYLSPEAYEEGVQEAACDVWAVGCIVAEMLTGRVMFGGDGDGELGVVEILRKRWLRRVEVPEEVSEEAREFLRGCFEKNPKCRWSVEKLLCHKFLRGLGEDEVISSDEEGLVSFCSQEDGNGDGDDDDYVMVYSCEEDDDYEIASSSNSCSGEDEEEEEEEDNDYEVVSSNSCSGEDDDENGSCGK